MAYAIIGAILAVDLAVLYLPVYFLLRKLGGIQAFSPTVAYGTFIILYPTIGRFAPALFAVPGLLVEFTFNWLLLLLPTGPWTPFRNELSLLTPPLFQSDLTGYFAAAATFLILIFSLNYLFNWLDL